jgi:hypothetical protein
MTIRKILGLLLVLFPLPAMCLDTSPLLAGTVQRPQLSLEDNYLQIAALTDQSQPETGTATTDLAFNPEYPHLDIPAEPDWDGLTDDTKLFLLYQVGVVGVLYLMPESISQWSSSEKSGNVFRKWDNNVNNLRKDKDQWVINFIGHPYFGAVYYVRARHRGFERGDSFWYGFIMSTIYEYGIEAVFEPASVQDMIFTPVGGAIMGEYFMAGRESIKRGIAERGYTRFRDKVGLFFTDPLGAINTKVKEWFNIKDEDDAQLELYPLLKAPQQNLASMQLQGIQAFYRW